MSEDTEKILKGDRPVRTVITLTSIKPQGFVLREPTHLCVEPGQEIAFHDPKAAGKPTCLYYRNRRPYPIYVVIEGAQGLQDG